MQRRITELGAGARLRRVDDRVSFAGDLYRGEEVRLRNENEILTVGLTERNAKVVARRRLVADAPDGDAVLIVRLEALNGVLSGGPGKCAGSGSGSAAAHLDLHRLDRITVGVCNRAGHCSGGYTLGADADRRSTH